MKKNILYLTLLTILSGCYPNPTDDDYCVVPVVNNRDITKEKEDPFQPKMSY